MDQKVAAPAADGAPPPTVVPNSFVCPISLQIMLDPVFASDGFTYERTELENHLSKSKVSPMTREPLEAKLIPNRTLKSDIIAFMEKHPELADEWYSPPACGSAPSLVRAQKWPELQALLTEHPVLVNKIVEPGNTLFHLICQHGSLSMVSSFLDLYRESVLKSKHAPPADWKPVFLNAYFMDAVKAGNLAAVKLAVQLGAELAAMRDKHGLAALAVAAKDGNTAMVELLLSLGAPGGGKGGDGRTALHWAAHDNRPRVISLLAGRGAELGGKDGTGWTALHHASYNGHVAAFEALVGLGAPLNEQDLKGWTCLHWAAWAGHEPIVRRLLQLGAAVNSVDFKQWSPLHWASHNGHEGVVRLLAEAGAAVEAKTDRGWTPLHAAAYNGHKGSIRALLEAGAYWKAPNQAGKTPGQLAVHNKNPKVEEYVRQVHLELKAQMAGKLRSQLETIASLNAKLADKEKLVTDQARQIEVLQSKVSELETVVKNMLSLAK